MRPTALVLLAATLIGCGKGTGGPTATEPPPVPATATDLAAVQGTWAIVRVEQAGTAALGPEAFREFEVAISDQEIRIDLGALGSFHGVFDLDAEHSPRHLNLAETNSDGKPQSKFLPGKAGDVVAAIYRLEGDTLVIAAAPRAGEPRPAEFKPAPPTPDRSAGVVVVYLKKQ